MAIERTIVDEITSAVGNAVPGTVRRAAQACMEVHVQDALGNFVQVLGGDSPVVAEMNLLRYYGTPGSEDATTLGPGYYKIVERPMFMVIQVAADAGGPRDYRVATKFTPKE